MAVCDISGMRNSILSMRLCGSGRLCSQCPVGWFEPLEFLLPCYGAADRWFYGAGLALYDLLSSGHSLGQHRRVDAIEYEPELASDGLTAGLVFHDCKVNSARLVLENILDAEARGAAVANYVEAHVTGNVDRRSRFADGRAVSHSSAQGCGCDGRVVGRRETAAGARVSSDLSAYSEGRRSDRIFR